MRAGRRLGVALVAVMVIGLAALLAPPVTDRPLDPRSAGPSGLQGLVDLATTMGTQVDIAIEPPNDVATRVLLPRDRLGSDRRSRWEAWVRAGGVLVVADPSSPLAATGRGEQPVTATLGAVTRRPACALPALDDVREVRQAGWTALRADDGQLACFPVADDGHWLVARTEGDGVIVALGSADAFVNGRLDDADNAVLALALLAPSPGGRLQIVPPPAPGEGESPITALIPGRLRDALLLALVAVVAAALWRGRRLGPPPAEVLPPTVPAAELARSLGDLLQRSGNRDDAARRLREDARRHVAHDLALPADALAAGHHLDLVARRTGLPHDVVASALLDRPLASDAELPAVAAAAARLRQALLCPG